jgi:F-type H+-transporting ATPase subunit b
VTLIEVAHAASDAHGDEYAEHAAEHTSAGLPQMDISWFPTQIFWLLIMFAVLYVVFAKRVLPELSTIIENRRSHIQNDLDTAQSLKDEAEGVQQAYEEILEDARQTSSASFVKMDNDLKTKAMNEQQAFQERAATESQAFEGRLSSAKENAMKDMEAIAAEMAALAAEKLVGIPADLSNAKTAVKAVNKQTKKAA